MQMDCIQNEHISCVLCAQTIETQTLLTTHGAKMRLLLIEYQKNLIFRVRKETVWYHNKASLLCDLHDMFREIRGKLNALSSYDFHNN